MKDRTLGKGLRGLGSRRTDPRLFSAAAEGDADCITELLAQGALPNARRQEDGRSALELAVPAGHTAAVRALLAGGAAAGASSPADYGMRPLALAALEGHPGVLAALLEAGADPHATNDVGCTALYFSGASGSLECAALLLDAGAQPAPNHQGQSPLHIASEQGHAALVELLLRRCPGLYVNAAEHIGMMPLHFASHHGHAATARLLLAHGAEVEAQDEDGKTPLMFAAEGGHTEAAAALLEPGAAVNATTPHGRTPLIRACVAGSLPTAQPLLQHGADPLHADQGGCNPLIMAPERPGQTQLVAALPAGGAAPSVNAVDVVGCTALYFSASNGDAAAARLLLVHGADPCICNESGQSALHNAAQIGCEPVVELLLAAPGIEALRVLHKRDSQGKTPLYFAVMGRSAGVVRRLLAHGARPEIPNARGQTPLHLASQSGLSPTVSLLLKARPEGGVHHDAFPAEICRYTPLHFAADQGQLQVVRQLLAAEPEMAAARTLRGHLPVQLVLRKGFMRLACTLLEEGQYFGEGSQAEREALLMALRAVGNTSLPLYAGLAQHCRLTPREWSLVQTLCPGLAAALPAVLARSKSEAGQLVQHLPAGKRERLRAALLSLHCLQRQACVELPPVVLPALLRGVMDV